MLTLGEALQFIGLIGASWLVLWRGLRPLSFVYRLERGRLSVRTFFILPVAGIRLSEIIGTSDTAPPAGKPMRKLVSPYRRIARETMFAETEREWLELPAWLRGNMAESSLEAAAPDGSSLLIRGDAGYQRALAAVMALNLAVRKLASWSVILAPAAAWCLILLPLYLTAIDVIGSKIFADEIDILLSRVLGSSTLPHFAASAFLILCGVVARGVIEAGKPMPLLLAGITFFAAISRFFISFPGGHDVLSHTLFDSCTGYASCHARVAFGCLAAAVILVLAAWHQHGIRNQLPAAFPAGTP